MAAYSLSYANLPERERPAALLRASAVIRVGCGRETASSHWLLPGCCCCCCSSLSQPRRWSHWPPTGLQPMGEFAVWGAEPADQMCEKLLLWQRRLADGGGHDGFVNASEEAEPRQHCGRWIRLQPNVIICCCDSTWALCGVLSLLRTGIIPRKIEIEKSTFTQVLYWRRLHLWDTFVLHLTHHTLHFGLERCTFFLSHYSFQL